MAKRVWPHALRLDAWKRPLRILTCLSKVSFHKRPPYPFERCFVFVKERAETASGFCTLRQRQGGILLPGFYLPLSAVFDWTGWILLWGYPVPI
jgi:hypothetical protein